MTVQKELTKNIYVGNGQTTKFPFTFECPDNHPEYIRVYVAGKKNELTETTNFGVDMANKSITYPANGEPLAIDEQLVIMRELPVRQLMNLVNNGSYFAEDIETAFDEGIMIAQQSSEKLGRALVAPPTSTTFDTQIPIEPGKTFRISDDGTHLQATEDPGKVIDEAKGLLSETTIKAEETAANTQEAKQANAEIKTIYNNGSLTPITNLAGSIGTALKRWGYIFANKVFAMNLPIVYKSVAEMKADSLLSAGMTACTLGYYSPNDGGGATYIIRAKAEGDVDDGGSLHELANGNVAELVVENGTVNVRQFGAKGDGVNDDLLFLKKSIAFAISQEYKLLFIGIFYITDTLMRGDEYSDTTVINFEGYNPLRLNTYIGKMLSCIKFKNGINVFENLSLRGSITRMSFMPQSRSVTGSIFYSCTLSSFYFMYNNVSNVLAFLNDTSLHSVSEISYNRFLTVYYFHKFTNKATGCTDSVISHNYINGGMELNDNACFQFDYYNGTTISHNFIDYYRVIYQPLSTKTFRCQGPQSTCNHYQVFRYLYHIGDASSFVFNSVSDVINWTNPLKLDKLTKFEPLYYTDISSKEKKELPFYTFYIGDLIILNVSNLYVQSNCSSLIFIASSCVSYPFSFNNIKNIIVDDAREPYEYWVNHAPKFFLEGKYKNSKINIPFVKKLEKLPASLNIWSSYYLGEKVKVGDNMYQLVYGDQDNTGTSKFFWTPIYTNDFI